MRAFHKFKIKSILLYPPFLETATKIINEIVFEKAAKLVGEGVKFSVSDVIIHDDPFYQKGEAYYIDGFASKVAIFNINID
jgi:hypothetical protein